eukprot:2678619-Pyramimonas_sp.AAC.2
MSHTRGFHPPRYRYNIIILLHFTGPPVQPPLRTDTTYTTSRFRLTHAPAGGWRSRSGCARAACRTWRRTAGGRTAWAPGCARGPGAAPPESGRTPNT